MTRCTQETIRAVVSKKSKRKKNGRTMSEETTELHEKRKQVCAKKKPTKEELKRWNRKISRNCRDDYRKWTVRWTEEIEKEAYCRDKLYIYTDTVTVQVT